MSIFGGFLPPGCGALPGEEFGAYEVRIDGVWYAWDEDDRVYRQEPGNADAREDGYIFVGTLAWPDEPEADTRVVLHNFIKQLKGE